MESDRKKRGFEMKVLVACEESQAVTIELRKLGHEAFSCDIEECSGGIRSGTCSKMLFLCWNRSGI